MKKNDKINLNIERVSESGDGIGYAPDGKVIFCAGALPGERVNALIIKVTERYYIAKLLSIDEDTQSGVRITPPCSVYNRCGGCVLGHVSYEGQLAVKEAHVHDCIKRIGGIDGYEAERILPSPDTLFYRNKSIYQFDAHSNTTSKSGFYRRNSHDIVDCSSCVISDKKAEQVRACFSQIALERGISFYSESKGDGLLRRIMVRTSLSQNTAMVVIVINGATVPHLDEVCKELTALCPFVKSIYINVNRDRNNTVMGKDFRLVYGELYLEDSIGPAKFKISPQSFFQVNPNQTVRLYEKAFEYANIKDGEHLLDLFCGIGTIGIYFASRCAEKSISLGSLLGIEYTPEAIEDAKVNASLNGNSLASISSFVAGDAEKTLAEISSSGKLQKPDIVVLDPPRKGCTAPLLKAVAACSPSRIVYVSCNPATLARDLKELSALGYKTKKVCPMDMFPNTEHVETVALLGRE